MDTGKKKAALKAFRDLWVAGTVGGFFAALVRSIPHDFGAFIKSADAIYGFDMILRYAYMFWFVAYFLVSNLNKESLRKGDVTFDVIQSVAAFAAAFALGIAVRGEGFQVAQSLTAFGFANAAVLMICVSSLLLFGFRDNSYWNGLRIVGALVAVSGVIVGFENPVSVSGLIILAFIFG